jgi:hypothetical protein
MVVLIQKVVMAQKKISRMSLHEGPYSVEKDGMIICSESLYSVMNIGVSENPLLMSKGQ